jgi:hypothetical protein
MKTRFALREMVRYVLINKLHFDFVNVAIACSIRDGRANTFNTLC